MKCRPTRRRLLTLAGVFLCVCSVLFLAAFRPLEEVLLEQAPFFVESMARIEQVIHPAASAASVPALVAGSSRVEIAPPLDWNVPLGGNRRLFFKRASGKHDESVHARSLALQQGERMFVLTCADVLVIHPALRQRTLERIRERVPLESRDFLLVATHSHNAPGGYWPGLVQEQVLGAYQERVFEHLAQSFARSAVEAWERKSPARVSWHARDVPEPIGNRSVEDGLENPELAVVRFAGLAEEFTIDLIGYSAHPTMRMRDGNQYSGDYPGVLADLIESEHHTVMFLPGTIGDQWPAYVPGKAWSALGVARQLRSGGVSNLKLERLELTPALESFELEVLLPPLQPRLVAGVFGTWCLRPWLAEAVIGELEHTTLHVVRLGPLLLLGAPADLATSVGMPVLEEARRRGYRPLFVSMAEDWIGYVMSEEEYRQADFKFSSQLHGPAMGPYFERLYKKIVRQLDRPRTKARED